MRAFSIVSASTTRSARDRAPDWLELCRQGFLALDVVVVSRRIGDANPTVTLNTYGHLFKKDDSAAVAAIEAALRTGRER